MKTHTTVVKLGLLAELTDSRLLGSPDTVIDGVATLSGAMAGDITFLTNNRYRSALQDCQASAIILSARDQEASALPRLISDNPYACYARVAQVLFPAPIGEAGVHPQAWVDPSALLGAGVSVAAGAVIEAGAVLEAGVMVGAGSTIGARVRLGAGVRLYPRVTIYADCEVGARSILHSGCVIGADGFGMAPDQGRWVKIPQVGRVIVGADVEIGANTTIDRGAIEDTVIEEGVKLDNQIQIAHNCHIGAHTVIAACTGIAGSTRVGRHCRIGGGAGLVGHLEIGDGVTISVFSLITKSIKTPGVYTASIPSQPHREWMETLAHLRSLPRWIERIKTLENEKKPEENP